MKNRLKKFLVFLFLFLVIGGVVGFATYFISTEIFGAGSAPAIGGESHNKNIYEINQNNGLNTFPTLGNPKILVIPVSFTDYDQYSTEENRQKIEKTFFVQDESNEEAWKSSNGSWYSVAQYYYLSSGGNLKISGKVSEWFNVGISTNDLITYRTNNEDYKYSGEDGTWWLLNQAVDWYKSTHNDINSFDTDHDNLYDLIWLVYNAPYYTEHNGMSSTFWAFTYTNIENYDIASPTNKQGYNYCFASLHFIWEGFGKNGLDAHTYIHETGHAMGLSDYYSTNSVSNGKPDSFPFGGVDMMDFNIGDHCAYSKYRLGWISPKEVIDKAGEYSIKSTSDTGEFLIVSKNFKGHPFDEYFVIEYITPTGLNYVDYNSPYPGNNLQGYSKPGIRISHVDARGVKITMNGSDYSFVHETNFNLIEGVLIHNSTREDIYRIGNSYCRENVIMQKNITSFETSVLSSEFPIGKNMNDLLFYKNETFSLNNNSKYCQLMPSNSNVLDDGTVFDLTITVMSIGDEAKIIVS